MIAVVGLGKVGLPLAMVLSEAGLKVQAIEKRLVQSIPSFRIYRKPNSQLRLCEYVFIIVQTPSLPSSQFDLSYVEEALKELKPYLDKYATVAICSTVNVGDIAKLKKIWRRIAYTPLMIAQGTVAKDLVAPEYVLIGADNQQVTSGLKAIWRQVVQKQTPFILTSTRNMELIKIASNFLLPTKIVLVNLIAELCEMYGGDFDEVVRPLKLDTRLSGPRMWKAGLGYGGPCFPRDIENFNRHMDGKILVDVIATENYRMVYRSIKVIREELIRSEKRLSVAVLGITYKPGVGLTTASQAMQIVERLTEQEVNVDVYDPSREGSYKNARDCVASNDLIFIAVPWEEFADLKAEDFREDQVVIDPWRILRQVDLPCRYIAYGVGSTEKELGDADSQ